MTEIINPLEKLPSSPRMVFCSKSLAKLRKSIYQINQIQEIQNAVLIRWSRIRGKELPTSMHLCQESFQLAVQQWKSNLQPLQVNGIIVIVHHDMSSSRKSRHEFSTPCLYVCTGIMGKDGAMK